MSICLPSLGLNRGLEPWDTPGTPEWSRQLGNVTIERGRICCVSAFAFVRVNVRVVRILPSIREATTAGVVMPSYRRMAASSVKFNS